MTFKAEFSFDSIEALQAFIGATHPTPASVTVATASSATPSTVNVADKKDVKSGKVTKGPKPEPVPAEEVKSGLPFIGKKAPPVAEKTKEETKPALSYDYVSQATLDAVKATNRDKVKELLTTFGVAKATELTEAQWPDYIKGCGALIKAASAEKVSAEEELA